MTTTTMTNKEIFKETYLVALKESVEKYPLEYAWPVAKVPAVAEKMFAALDRGSASVDSRAFCLTARRLGIKPTRKAIFAYWDEGTITKRVAWAYPSSPNAMRFGFGRSGCWVVEQVNGIRAPKPLKGFATRDEALAFGNALSETWAWSDAE